MFRSDTITSRALVWLAASMSFAALLVEFYDVMKMQTFAVTVLPLAILFLIWVAYQARNEPRGAHSPYTWIVEGAIAGVVAAVVYDLYRLPFVLAGKPLFAVFPQFGQLLLDAAPEDQGLAVQVTGWGYHFSNGAALGVMLLAMLPSYTKKTLLIGGAVWGLLVEIILLATPYYAFFQLKLPQDQFLFLTLTAHLVFGLTLGWWCARRLGDR
jgi:hypothetical protein